MLYEIYIFIAVTILLIVLLFYKVILWLISPLTMFFSFLKKEYYKWFSLNMLKKQVLKDEEKNDENEVKEGTFLNILEGKLNTTKNKLTDIFFTKKEEGEEKTVEIKQQDEKCEKQETKETKKQGTKQETKVIVYKQDREEIKTKSKIDKLFLKVEVAKQKGNLEEFEKYLIEILSVDENNIKALEMLSNYYINVGKDKKAFSLLKKLIQLDMKNDNAIWNLSKLYLELGEIDTADILIQKAVSINARNHRYFVTYADILYNKGDIQGAIGAIEKVLEIKPKNVIYLDALASLYEELGDLPKARSYWLEILDLEPDYEKAREKIQHS